ncbi:MAG: YchJ family metal-binding protein [Verrucomicrobiota bacterium]
MMKFDKCPCGSGVGFKDCCGGIVSGQRTALTAEQLMRSRYTAYVAKKVDYLVQTTHPSSRTDDLADSIRKWMRQVEWLKLHVIATADGQESDSTGRVEFVAEYLADTGPARHHECSVFEKADDIWYYVGEECE